MIRRRAVAGLALLSALLFCAFVAQSASALVATSSKNTTAFTCVEGGGSKDFKDAHCDEAVTPGTGGYGHVAIQTGSTKELDATNAKVTNGTKDHEPVLIKGTIGLAKVTIECTTMKTVSKNSKVHNVEPVEKQHTLTGNGTAEFSICNVKETAKCVVAEPIVANATFHGVEGIEGPKGEKNAMGVEFVGEGENETFGNIEFKNKGAETCSLNGKTFPVQGRVIGTSGPTTESAQENKHSGATIVFKNSAGKVKTQTLKLGPNAAEAQMITTPTGVSGPPISITTTT